MTLEQAVNHIQTITGVPDAMKDYMNDVVLAAQITLENFPPFDEVDSDSWEDDNDCLPSDNLDASPQSSGDGRSPCGNHSHPDEITANEMLRTIDIASGDEENYFSSEDTVDIPHISLPTQNRCLSWQQTRETVSAYTNTATDGLCPIGGLPDFLARPTSHRGTRKKNMAENCDATTMSQQNANLRSGGLNQKGTVQPDLPTQAQFDSLSHTVSVIQKQITQLTQLMQSCAIATPTQSPPSMSNTKKSELNPRARTFCPTPSRSSHSGDDPKSLQAALLKIQIQNQARDLMIQSRPPEEHKFSGKKHEDLESMLAAFDHATQSDGITDEMKFLELRHYCAGNASLVVDHYRNERNPTTALRKVREDLYRQFGRTLSTAREMLDELLSGEKIDHNDPYKTTEFILQLQNCYQRAVETNREASFSTPETYQEIIRKKLGRSYGREWGEKMAYAVEKCSLERSDKHALKFPDFLKFCKMQLSIERTQKKYLDASQLDAEVAATDLETIQSEDEYDESYDDGESGEDEWDQGTESDQGGEPEQESESDQEADPEHGQGSDYTLMFR